VTVSEPIDAGKVQSQFPQPQIVPYGATVRIDIGQWKGTRP
jgi:hypothetical protein